jgi:hypothetical protein
VRCRSSAWLLTLALVSLAVSCSSSGSAKSATTTPTTTPTASAPATTSALALVSTNGKPAILGSSPEAVRERLGERDEARSTSDTDVFGHCDTPTQHNIYEFSVSYNDNYAYAVDRQPCDAVTKDENLAEALLYVPADARNAGTVRHDTPGEDDYTYSSHALSRLPADLFSGCPRGSFVVAVDSSGWDVVTVGCSS